MNDTINKIAESKIRYHRKVSQIPFEEKYKIIVALQKIDLEFRKKNPKKEIKEYYKSWEKVV